MARHPSAPILTLLAFYSFTALTSARVRPLWFDELGTWTVASQPTIRQMFLAAPPDGQPPLYYLLARGSMAFLGQNAYGLRLPALLAFLVTLYCVYLFVARRIGPLYGFLAAMELCASRAAWYSMECRPYTLLLAGTSLALVCWQRATSIIDGPAGAASCSCWTQPRRRGRGARAHLWRPLCRDAAARRRIGTVLPAAET